MIFRNRILALIIIFILVYAFNILAQPKLFIKNGIEDYPLDKHISLLEDKAGKLTIYEAASDSLKNKYIYYDRETINLQFTASAYWVRFIIVDTLSNQPAGMLNSQFRNWILIKNEPLIENISLYYRNTDENKNTFIEHKAGNSVPDKEKLIETDDYVASFPVQKDIPDTVFLRIKTRSQFIISFNILTTKEYVIHSSNKYFFHGLLFGIFFLLITYNLLLYFSIRDNTYILYVFYIFCYMFFIFTYQGYYFELFGGTFSRDYFILPLASISIGGVFWLLLTREFLLTKLYLPQLYKLLTYITPIAPVTCILTFVFFSPRLAAVTAFILICYYIIGFISAILAFRKGISISKYYLLAVAGMALGVFITSSARNYFIPIGYGFWSRNAVSLGLLWEALILATTVGYRFNLLRAEKEREKAMMRNQIASDLHDEVGSYLSAVALQSRMIMKLPEVDKNIKNKLRVITNITEKTTETIRDIVWFINPYHDKSEDLLVRMKDIASEILINLKYDFTVSKSNERIFDKLPDLNKRRHVYLIFKEVLNNIVKHSDAKVANINLSLVENNFKMIITDKGKGFNENEIVHGEGLRNLRNRADQLGGKIIISSDKEKGTKIILEVPV